ncbi:MAG: hypothetical protein VYD87_04655 [Pseudomonadota bacterium]|nr:hypothetical protein [Pseudomonadota bacterium]
MAEIPLGSKRPARAFAREAGQGMVRRSIAPVGLDALMCSRARARGSCPSEKIPSEKI